VLLMQHNSSTARQPAVELLIDMPAVKVIELKPNTMMSVPVLAARVVCTGRYRAWFRTAGLTVTQQEATRSAGSKRCVWVFALLLFH
jgi:hypothetical protein